MKIFSLLLLSFNLFAATSAKLALNWKPEQEFGGFYAAQLNNHYQKNNLAIDILEGGTTTPVVQLVASGKAEFGILSGDEVILAHQNNMDIVAIYNVYQTSPMMIMSHKEKKAKNLQDVFTGGILAVEKGHPYFKFLETKYDLSKTKVVPYTGGVREFLANKELSQQGFITSEPIAAKKAGAQVDTFLVSDAGYDPYTEVVVTTKKYYEKNKATVDAFLKATHNGWKDYLNKKDTTEKVNAHMHKLNPTMDIATLNEGAKAQINLIVNKKYPLGTFSEERWNKLAKQLVDLKVVKTIKPAKEYFIEFK
jgi:NitT/TauT family transport system substrate-binding protein